MGERGANREAASAEDIAQMAALAETAMHAGGDGLFDVAHPQPPHVRWSADANADRR